MQQKFIKDIFFRVYEGAEETLIYDQLEESNKQGVSIGDQLLVSLEATVSNDFRVKCFRRGRSSFS